jgi:hypothetical protein
MFVSKALISPPTGPRRWFARATTSRLVLVSAITLVGLPAGAASAEGTSAWSAPAVLSSCPGTGTPHVVFPSDSPTHGTGPGAIVWSASSRCPGGAGVRVAVISPEDIPGQGSRPRSSTGQQLALRGPLSASSGPFGRIVIAAASDGMRNTPASGLLLSEGQAGGPFTRPIAPGGPASSFAFTTAYLGDVALASPGDAHSRLTVQLRVQRHYANRFAAPVQVSGGAGSSVDALTVALDYRSDALAVWARQGSVYARDLPASGAPGPMQRLGASALTGTRISAVISDDDRAIVAWTDWHAGESSVYVSLSQTGVRFGAPTLLERFADPHDLTAYADSPRIVRLSSESVLMAWTGAQAGHLVIRAAAIDLDGVQSPSTISPVGSNALLAALAPGPRDEALVLWSEPQQTPAGLDLRQQAIFAARGFDDYPGKTTFTTGEEVAPPGPNSEATVALDPDSDRAIAVWRTGVGVGARGGVGAGAIAYAVRSPGA